MKTAGPPRVCLEMRQPALGCSVACRGTAVIIIKTVRMNSLPVMRGGNGIRRENLVRA